MFMKAYFLVAGLSVAALGFQGSMSHPLIKKSTDTLQAAKSMTVKLTIGEVGGVADEETLVFSKPHFLKLDTPKMTYLSDGTTVRVIDKAKKTYKEIADDPGFSDLMKSVPEIFIFSGFFDAEFGKKLDEATTGADRRVRQVPVTEVIAKQGKVNLKLLFDAKLGTFRGAMYKNQRPAGVVTTMISASEIEVSKTEASPDLFAFKSDGLQEESAMQASAPKYADVQPIFAKNCIACHGGNKPAAGLLLTSYESMSMQQRPLWTAGDPSSSRLYNIIKSGKMPPGRKLTAEDLQKISDWIAGGAKKE